MTTDYVTTYQTCKMYVLRVYQFSSAFSTRYLRMILFGLYKVLDIAPVYALVGGVTAMLCGGLLFKALKMFVLPTYLGLIALFV